MYVDLSVECDSKKTILTESKSNIICLDFSFAVYVTNQWTKVNIKQLKSLILFLWADRNQHSAWSGAFVGWISFYWPLYCVCFQCKLSEFDMRSWSCHVVLLHKSESCCWCLVDRWLEGDFVNHSSGLMGWYQSYRTAAEDSLSFKPFDRVSLLIHKTFNNWLRVRYKKPQPPDQQEVQTWQGS